MKFVLAVVGLAAAALAQQSAYTGPMFDEDTAPFFDSTGLVYPTSADGTPAFPSAPTITSSYSSSAIPISSSMVNVTLSTTFSRNSTTLTSSTSSTSSHSSSHSSTPVSVSRTASSTAAETTTSRLTPTETGAAVANFPEALGMMVGGLVAGMAIL